MNEEQEFFGVMPELVVTPQGSHKIEKDYTGADMRPLDDKEWKRRWFNREFNRKRSEASRAIIDAGGFVASMANPLYGTISGAVHTGLAAKDIKDNGLNQSNGVALGMGLAPLVLHGVRFGSSAVQRFRNRPKFKSELDWSPESWFGTRQGHGFDAEDVAALKKHIPEYHKIERTAKANGTWLKMPDGSTWTGDPRSWVQLMSKDGQKYSPEVFWTGIKSPTINSEYHGTLWGVTGKGLIPRAKARTYASTDENVLPMFTDSRTSSLKVDARGQNWAHIDGKSTNTIVKEAFENGKKKVNIQNVGDTGMNTVYPWNSKYSLGNLEDDILVTNNPDFPQDDIILSSEALRKSLVGNNGNFGRTTRNIFKGLSIPIISSTIFGNKDKIR